MLSLPAKETFLETCCGKRRGDVLISWVLKTHLFSKSSNLETGLKQNTTPLGMLVSRNPTKCLFRNPLQQDCSQTHHCHSYEIRVQSLDTHDYARSLFLLDLKQIETHDRYTVVIRPLGSFTKTTNSTTLTIKMANESIPLKWIN